MARTARDCALILQAIAGASADDPTSVDRPVPDYAAALIGDASGLRIGVEREHHSGVDGFDPACRDRFEDAVRALRGRGCRDRGGALRRLPADHRGRDGHGRGRVARVPPEGSAVAVRRLRTRGARRARDGRVLHLGRLRAGAARARVGSRHAAARARRVRRDRHADHRAARATPHRQLLGDDAVDVHARVGPARHAGDVGADGADRRRHAVGIAGDRRPVRRRHRAARRRRVPARHRLAHPRPRPRRHRPTT